MELELLIRSVGAGWLMVEGDIDFRTYRAIDEIVRLTDDGTELRFDLGGLRFIDSKGLASLLRATRDHIVCLRGLPTSMRLILDLSGTAGLFDIAAEEHQLN